MTVLSATRTRLRSRAAGASYTSVYICLGQLPYTCMHACGALPKKVTMGRHHLRSGKVVSYRNGEGENGAPAHVGLFQPRLHARMRFIVSM